MEASVRTNRRGRVRACLILAALLGVSACTGAKLPNQAAGKRSKLKTTDTTLTPAEAAAQATTASSIAAAQAAAAAKGGKGAATQAAALGKSVASDGSNFHSTLFSDAEDRIGITNNSITMCAHAALTYAAAFHTDVKDLNVFWSWVNDHGGIYGRKVTVTYENDNYDPQTAITAASTCRDKNIFMLLGGIGFDQIPAVRDWVENLTSKHLLYLYHTANETTGKRYSFTELPTTQSMGKQFAQLAAARYHGQAVGILKRHSDNWEPGVTAFKAEARRLGVKIVYEKAVEKNAANYTQELLDAKAAGAQVMWGWENALAATEMVQQAKNQSWSPNWMLFPFNLTSQTIGDAALAPKLSGLAMFPAFSYGDFSGEFAKYADDMKEFQAQYAQYDGGNSGVDLHSFGGDLLFLNWTAQKALYTQFLACGQDCTRNKFIDVLHGYKKKPISSSCFIDFTRPNTHLGGYAVNVMETYKNPSDGKVNWRNTQTCVETIG
ncbi:MAG: branched-chain amino acid transport system substrate-binding protein [Actinomycetota bacterium]|jgi:ABC-type branched-subunit amino acid transport system substrate-binding protein|nr:branched-chain amino acid transport system substrate-binding protein [Actinomycetota bacterium]